MLRMQVPPFLSETTHDTVKVTYKQYTVGYGELTKTGLWKCYLIDNPELVVEVTADAGAAIVAIQMCAVKKWGRPLGESLSARA